MGDDDTDAGGRPGAAPPRWVPSQERERDSDRVEAFSDAVMAIVLTLMSVELLGILPRPLGSKDVGVALLHEWPAYLGYLISFLIVGQIWLTHHNMWRYVERVDQMLVVFNLLLLLFVAPIPFTAALLAAHLRGSPGEQRLTAAIYVGTILAGALFFNLSWSWASRRRLLDRRMRPDLVRAIGRRYRLGPVLYVVAFAFVFVNAVLSLVLYLLIVGLYVFPGAGDLPSRTPGPGHPPAG